MAIAVTGSKETDRVMVEGFERTGDGEIGTDKGRKGTGQNRTGILKGRIGYGRWQGAKRQTVNSV